MNSYERLIAKTKNIIIDETNLLQESEGIYTNKYGLDVILIKDDMSTYKKRCVLLEELGHYNTTSGDITDQSKTENRKQEKMARNWAYDRAVGITGLINAYKSGIRNKYELANFLEVTEEFLEEALKHMAEKYGTVYYIDNYIIYFNPLGIFENFDSIKQF